MSQGVTRARLLAVARELQGQPYAHQGRLERLYAPGKANTEEVVNVDFTLRGPGVDCIGSMLYVGRYTGLSSFEKLGYSAEPDGEEFGRLLREEMDELPEVAATSTPWPWGVRPGDLLAHDYGGGIQHVSMVTNYNGWRWTCLHATRTNGCHESGLELVYSKAIVGAFRARGLAD